MKSQKSSSRYDSKEYKEELKHQKRLRKIERDGERILRKQELKAKKNSYKKSNKKIQTSKIYFALLFISCTCTQIFSMTAMWHFGNLDSLSVLIGSTLTEGIGMLGYYLKSYHETKEEEKIKFEKEKFYNEFNNAVSITNTTAVG